MIWNPGKLQHKYVYVDWGTRLVLSTQSVIQKYQHCTYAHFYRSCIALDFILEKGGSAYLPVSLVEPFIESGQLHVGVKGWRLVRARFIQSYQKQHLSVDAIMQVEKLARRSTHRQRTHCNKQLSKRHRIKLQSATNL